MKKKSAKTNTKTAGARLKKAVEKFLSKTIPARKKKSAAKKTISPKIAKQVSFKPIMADAQGAVPEIRDLPYSYNHTALVLLVRDPEWGFAYWDFSAQTWNWIQDFYKKNPGSSIKLRIHNLTHKTFFDVDVQLEAKSWYICLAHENQEFEAELGLLDPRGRFHRIVKSNRVRTPRNQPSEKIDPQWTPENFDELYRLSGGGQYGGDSHSLANFIKKNS